MKRRAKERALADERDGQMAGKQLGIVVESAGANGARVRRKTSESEIRVRVEFGKPRRKYSIKTPLAFLNHMIEHVAYNCGFNVDVGYKAKSYRLTHVVCEDTGIVLGRALREVLLARMKKGVSGRGSNARSLKCADAGIIDEAGALVAVSAEGRPRFEMTSLNRNAELKYLVYGRVEDMNGADLDDFLSGFAYGLLATVNVYVLSGRDPHHAWESVFRGLGCALRGAFEANVYRKGAIAGVKQTME